MIIVTGGAGFIGSNLVHYLNRLGEQDILVVDNFAPSPNLTGPKFINLLGAQFADYMDKHEFRIALSEGKLQNAGIRAILHQGACSNTLEDDGRYMMDNNFTYSKEVLHFAVERQIPLVYASTAAVYGANTEFEEISARRSGSRMLPFMDKQNKSFSSDFRRAKSWIFCHSAIRKELRWGHIQTFSFHPNDLDTPPGTWLGASFRSL